MQGDQPAGANDKLILILNGPEWKRSSLLSRQMQSCARSSRQLSGAREVVGVEVDFKNMADDPAVFLRNLGIRRFDQHYQDFCGFESVESAHLYLAVFEKLYCFTPFSDDAQPAIRGKCPLQLAGYDISQMPMTALCQGLSLDWPVKVIQHDVPY
jgi:hypothetical protein